MRLTQIWLPLALLTLLTACGGEATEGVSGPAEAQVRDSAGIRIVENSEDGVPRWTLTETSTLSIGALDGTDAQTLYQVGAVRRLGDGSWLVANEGTQEIRRFDPEGAHLGTVGRRGEGPGEFTGLSTIFPMPGDSVAAWDARQRRMSVFDLEGELGRSFQFDDLPEGSVRPLGRLASGSWVVYRNQGQFSTGGTGRGYAVRSSELYAIAGPDGSGTTLFVDLPSESGWVVQAADFVSFRNIPFAPDNGMSSTAERIVGGVTERAEVRVWNAEGVEVERWRILEPARPVTDAEWNAVRERELADLQAQGDGLPEGWRSAAMEFWDQVDRPTEWPAWEPIRTSSEGEVWLGGYTPSFGAAEGRTWRVFDASGQLVRAVETPAGFDLRWIGEGLVAGVERDDFDVEYLRVYEVVPAQ